MGTYLGRWDLQEKMTDGEVDASEVLSLVSRYLNGEYPLDGYTFERLDLSSFYANDWQIIGAVSLIQPSDGLSAGFKINFSKADGSTLKADFFSKGINSPNSFKDDTTFKVNALMASGDRLDIQVKTMLEGRDGELVDGYTEYPIYLNSEFYDIYYKNTNGTGSTSDDVIIDGNHDGSGTSTLDSDKGKDKGAYSYQNELGVINFTYGGSWNDSETSTGGDSQGTYKVDLEGYYVNFAYSMEAGTTSEYFTIKNLKYEVPEGVIELSSYRFELPEAPVGYDNYLDQAFEADDSGPVDPVIMRSGFDEFMLPLILNGNNRITGGSGDDFIDGGVGSDTAVYRGGLADYTFSINSSGNWVIADNQANRDGTDTIQNIETLSFSDKKSVKVSSLTVTPIPGVVSISAVYDDDAGIKGLYLASDKSLVIADAGLSAGATTESAITLKASNGKNFSYKPAQYDELLVDLNDDVPYTIVYGKDKSWTTQGFDEQGIAVGRATNITHSDMLSLETEFDQDINGDGDIGDVIVDIILESSEVGGIYKLKSGAFAISDAGLSEGDAPSSSLLLKSSATKNWTPGSAEVLGLVYGDTGFKMILKSGVRFSELTFNDDGVQQGKGLALTNSTLTQREKDLGVDLTGDGYVGFIQDSKAVANGTVETFDGNRSVYSIYNTPMTWVKANAYAKSIGGQLAVIEDIEENDFLYEQILSWIDYSNIDQSKSVAKDGGSASYVWLGATDSITEGVWKWVNNENLDTDNFMWGAGALGAEPDDFGGKQDHLAMGLENWPVGFPGAGYGEAGQWNDVNGSNKLFFVVEFEGAYSYGA